jgi:Fe-S-cluster containining protein
MHENLQGLYSAVDAQVEQVRIRYPWWPCSNHCDSCCHSVFLVSQTEWSYLSEAYRALPKMERIRIRDRARAQVSQINMRTGYIPWAKKVQQVCKERFACPFLEGGSCLVYEHRTFTCRVFGYTLLTQEGKPYACDKVRDAILEHENVQMKNHEAIAKLADGVLFGELKPICAWLEC